LRNREGQRYAAIKDYIEQSGSRCILLTALLPITSYLDLSAQLRYLFQTPRLGHQTKALTFDSNMMKFKRHPQTSSLAAFEKIQHSEVGSN